MKQKKLSCSKDSGLMRKAVDLWGKNAESSWKRGKSETRNQKKMQRNALGLGLGRQIGPGNRDGRGGSHSLF